MKLSQRIFVLLLAIGLLAGCNTSPKVPAQSLQHNNMYSTLWVQTSAEYKANTLQTFRNAKMQLAAAKADTGLTAPSAAKAGSAMRVTSANWKSWMKRFMRHILNVFAQRMRGRRRHHDSLSTYSPNRRASPRERVVKVSSL